MKKVVLMLSMLFCGTAYASEVKVNMDVIKKIESNGNPLAHNRSSGARGLYQITNIVLVEFNQYNKTHYKPSDLYIPYVNEQIASWYMNKRIPAIFKHFKVADTIQNRIIAWNAGIVYARNGYAPKETRKFIAKYNKLTKSQK
jgi:hypothetical protein